MDRHEKGIEKEPGRVDQPLPEWNGSYAGHLRRLPKVVQKLLHGKILSPEEKAELLWRFFELDQKARARRRKVRTVFAVILVLASAAWLALYQRQWIADRVLAWLSPPATRPPV